MDHTRGQTGLSRTFFILLEKLIFIRNALGGADIAYLDILLCKALPLDFTRLFGDNGSSYGVVTLSGFVEPQVSRKKQNSDIKSVDDLKGKKIGVDEIGGTPHQVASLWLENAGISADPSDGEVTFLPYSDGNLEFEALANGEIDVAALWDPLGSIHEKAGDVRILFDLGKDPYFADHFCCFLYASNKVLEENPEEVAALLRAYRKAQEWLYENPEEAVDIIINKNYASIEDKELAVDLIKSYGFPSAAEHDENWDAHVEEDVKYFVDGLSQIGYLKSDPDQFAKDIYQKVEVK